MPHPSRNPSRYSKSTDWCRCPLCSKWCKSKAGQLRHIRAKHRNIFLNDPKRKDSLSDSALESRQGTSSSLGQTQSRSQTPRIDTEVPVNFSTLNPLPFFLKKKKENLEFILDNSTFSPSSKSTTSNYTLQSQGSDPLGGSQDGNQTQGSNIGFTNYHPIMNGRQNNRIL